jgi:hypothetical protein
VTDSSAWFAIALVLTALGATWTYLAWQKRGVAAGIRGAGWTLLPLAAWLTGTLRLATDISEDVSRWAGRLVFSPSVWLGIIVAGVAVVLIGGAGQLKKHGIGSTTRGAPKAAKPGKAPKAVKASKPTSDEDDIEAILRKHGIS